MGCISCFSYVIGVADARPTVPTKFFGTELGAQTTMDNERYIVNGAHQGDRLRELLDAFIDKFVLCASCKNPETELIITGKGKQQSIHRDCKACGAHTDIDMRHKLTTFILKNPPKKEKKGKKGMTAEANVGGPMVFEEAANGGGSNDDDSPAPTPVPKASDGADALGDKVKDLDLDDDEDDANSPYAQLGAWLAENRSASDADIVSKIKELDIAGKHKALIEIGEHLFTDNVAAEVETRAALLQALVTSEKHQKSFLGGFERLLANSPNSDDLLAKGTTSKALMALYQEDILDEEVLQNWGTHVSKKYVDKEKSKKVRKSADAFLKWLEEADDDESD